MRSIILFLLFFITQFGFSQTVLNFTSPGPQTWVCPPNVSQITVQCWGGGGGGGNSQQGSTNGGGGGGGGAFSQVTIQTTSNQTYYLNVGAGGNGAPAFSFGAAQNGNDSWFNIQNSIPIALPFVLAKGGLKGLNIGLGSANGGSSIQSIGQIIFSGGNGFPGFSNGGGGGGSSANQLNNGISGSSISGGVINPIGGNGGNGSTVSNGEIGLSPGGGGGGSNDAASNSGGNGGNGMIRISYFSNCTGIPLTPIIFSNSTAGCGGLNLWTTGYANTPGLIFQWQSSNTVNGPWTNIPNSNDSLIVHNIYSDTYFRLQLTCSFGGQTANSNTIYYDYISNQNLVQPSAQSLTVNCGQNLTINSNGSGLGYMWTPFLQNTSFSTASNQLLLTSVNNDTTIYVQTYIAPPVVSDTIVISQPSQFNISYDPCGNGNIQGSSGYLGFDWLDNTPLGVTITQLKFVLNIGVECNPELKNIKLNGYIWPGFTTIANCSCLGGNNYVFVYPNQNDLNIQGINQFRIYSQNILGFFNAIPGFSGYYAKVIVSYTTNQPCISQQSPITIVTQTPTSAGVVSSTQNICSGNSPQDLIFTGLQAGLQGSIQWQYSNDSLLWTDIVGANSTNLNIVSNLGPMTSTKWFRVKLLNVGCATVYSNNVKVNVNPPPVLSAVGSSLVTICAGNSTPLVVSGAQSYTWSPLTGLNTTNGNSVIASPLSTQPYNVTGVNQYGCSSSYTFLVEVLPVAQGGTVGPQSSYSYCSGTNPSNLSITGQTGSIQWQYSYNNLTWLNYTNATTTSLTGSAIGPITQTTYIRVVTNLNGCGAAYSNTVTISVFSPTIAGTVGSNQSICSGSVPSALTILGFIGNTFQWQYSLNNSTWTNLTGATNDTLFPSVMSTLTFNQNYYFRVRVANGPCSIQYSNSILITVVSSPNAGAISSNLSICSGNLSPSLTVTSASGSLQWESSTNFSGPYTPITGQTTNSLASGVIGPLTQTTYFRVNASNLICGSVYSGICTVTVNPQSVAGGISSDQTICSGSSPSNLILTGNIGSIQWQSSPNGVNSWTNISGATSNILSSIAPLTSTKYFRAVVISGVCPSANSNVVTITVISPPSVGTISNTQTICLGTTPSNLTLSSNSGSIIWQSSSDNITFQDIIGQTGPTLLGSVIGAISNSTYFRVQVTNSPCASVLSNSVLITVTNPGTLSANQTICSGTSPVALTSTGYTGNIQWQYATLPTGTWNNIFGATSSTLSSAQMGTLTANRYYRVVSTATNGSCSVNSIVITITVSSPSTVGSIIGNQNVCLGSLPGNITLNSYNGTIQWQKATVLAGPYTNIGNGLNPLIGSQIGNITSTTYVRAQVTNQGCSTITSSVVTLSVIPLPIVNAGLNQTVCQGDSIILNGTGAVNYQWSNGVSNGNYFTPSSNALLTLTGTGTNGCVNTDQVQINVIPLPSINLNFITPTQICQGSSFLITASSTSAVTYQWYKNNVSIAGATQSTYSANQQGNYYVKVTSTINGCKNYSITVNLIVNPLPSLSITGDTMICNGQSTILTANSNGNITWNGNQNQSAVQVQPTSTTTYTVSALSSNNCQSQEQITVYVGEPTDTNLFISSFGPLLFNGLMYSSSGVFTQTLNNIYGCDSLITLNLNIEVNGVDETDLSKIVIFPNPNRTGEFTLNNSDEKEFDIEVVHDQFGRKIVFSLEQFNLTNYGITMPYVPGIYFIGIRIGDKVFYRKCSII
jgi:hypothetical protein